MSRFPLPIGRGASLPAGGQCAVMGILNVTPDSFSDGGLHVDVGSVVSWAQRMRSEGAAILDVGGESTRPGAEPVSVEEELRRVVPVIRALVERVGLPVSVDTTKAAVFREAFEAGASILNDVSGLTEDPALAGEVARTDAAVILMHRRGNPATMDEHCQYGDVAMEVGQELMDRVAEAEAAGISKDRIILDPGLGFSKSASQSLDLLRRISVLHDLGLPLLVGPSRKRFLGAVTGRSVPRDRDGATAAAAAFCARQGVESVRVHNVGLAVDAMRVDAALAGANHV